LTKQRENDSAERAPEGPPPRAFAVGTGQVFILVGTIYFLGSCCFWSFSGSMIEWQVPRELRWSEYLERQYLPQTLPLLSLLATLLGGLGLLAAGVGLYGERPSAGPLALMVTPLLAVVFGGVAVAQVVTVGAWRGAILPGLFCVVTGLLCVPAVGAAAELRQFPPPPDQNAVRDKEG